MQTRIIDLIEENKKKDKVELPEIFKKEKNLLQNPQNPSKLIRKTTGSMSLIERKLVKKSCELKSSISSITRRYAAYLFTSSNINKDVDVLSKNQFYKILKEHSSIFDTYLSGFHTYVWQANSKGVPEYQDIPSEL